jgi:hypothetical protein
VGGLNVQTARWLHDGKRIVFTGQRLPGVEKEFRLYVVPIEGGGPVSISDAAVRAYFLEVSRDDRFVAARDLDEVLTLYPLDGGSPIPLPELGKDVAPVGWTRDGQLWARALRELPSRMVRYDVPNRRVLEERTLSPSDLTGVTQLVQVCMTPDSRAVAFDYVRTLGHLSLLDGLAPARR